MKKILLSCFVFISIVQVKAQEVVLKTEIAANYKVAANAESAQLKKTLNLDKTQFAKVQVINNDRFEKLATVRSMYESEPEKRDEKIEQLETQYDAEFAAVLNEKQLKEYLELNGRSAAEPKKMKIAGGPTFNDQIQAILQKATMPTPDSAELTLLRPKNGEGILTDSAFTNTNLDDSVLSDSKSNQISYMIERSAENKSKGAAYDTQDKTKVKLDPEKSQLKVEANEGQLKMRGTKEKVETTDGTKYKADSKNGKTKTETSEREIKYKNGREKMKPKH